MVFTAHFAAVNKAARTFNLAFGLCGPFVGLKWVIFLYKLNLFPSFHLSPLTPLWLTLLLSRNGKEMDSISEHFLKVEQSFWCLRDERGSQERTQCAAMYRITQSFQGVHVETHFKDKHAETISVHKVLEIFFHVWFYWKREWYLSFEASWCQPALVLRIFLHQRALFVYKTWKKQSGFQSLLHKTSFICRLKVIQQTRWFLVLLISPLSLSFCLTWKHCG